MPRPNGPRGWGRPGLLGAIAFLSVALGPSPALAQTQAIDLLTGSGANTSASFEGSSSDGNRVFFETSEQMPGAGDGDTASDVYKAENGIITLLSGSGANTPASFKGSSSDGIRVFFETSEQVSGSGDSDTATDVYRAENGVINLISGSGANTPASFLGASADGGRVFFGTAEQMAGAADGDTATDVYRAESGTINLLSGSGANTAVFFAGASPDGARVYFETSESLAGTGDSDGARDAFKAESGTITLISGSGAATQAFFAGASSDGSRAFFITDEQMSGTGDGDTATDVYRNQGGTINLISGSGTNDPANANGPSADGSRYFFRTTEQIGGAGDGDTASDVYRAEVGTITLITGSGANTSANFQGMTADGSKVFFDTAEPIAGTGDGDASGDVYRAENGAITLLSGSGANSQALFRGASADGGRVFFTTVEPMAGTGDADAAQDIYRAEGGALTLLSGGSANIDAGFGGASTDGGRVLFTTSEQIAGTGDADASTDVYLSRIVPPAPPPPATPGTGPTGQRSAALKKCKKKKSKKARAKCRKKAAKLPL